MDSFGEKSQNATQTNLGSVVIFEAKKRGRPKKDCEGKGEEEKPIKKSKISLKRSENTKNSKNRLANVATPQCAPADNLRMESWIKKFEAAPVVSACADWTPGYKSCKLFSCYWCQEFSWDTKRCSNCKRLIPKGTRFLNVENSETVDAIVDSTRPIFHQPPIPYFRAGEVVFCTSCFYTSLSHDQCDICGGKIFNDQVLNIQFDSKHHNERIVTDTKLVLPFRPRKVGQCFIECPTCFLSMSLDRQLCVHCGSMIPKFVVISSTSNSTFVFDYIWPVRSQLVDGIIKTDPPNYVPVYKENMLATCPWCVSLSFDIFRCTHCMRQLPKNKNLVELTAGSLYGIGYGPAKPIYDPIPVPNFKPGKMSVCHECKKYSKNLRQCEFCGEKQRNYVAVLVSFKNTKLSHDGSKETLFPYTPRMVNGVYFECPQCELTTDKQKCIHCGLLIPSVVKVTELSKTAARKGRNLQGKIIPGNFKLDALSREDPQVNCGTITKKDRREDPLELPKGYEPRFRDKGVVQCESCLNWSWDFNRCSKCHNVILPTSLAIFPKTSTRHPAFDEGRPTITSPVPCMKLGVVTFCSNCLSFVTSTPKCTECFKCIVDKDTLFLVEAQNVGEKPGANSVKFQPRMLTDKSMMFCLFCGFSTSNFKVCTFCSNPTPQFCKVTPVNGAKSLPKELDFAQMKDPSNYHPPSSSGSSKEQTASESKCAVEDAIQAELIVINDWKTAIGLECNNKAKEYLETIPFGLRIDAFYDHQLSCFPDEIFDAGKDFSGE
ncbi:Hypothetical predicted protein [Cloeon dipterum]|uniref:Uncharacterized protein n=1 Tax=Cloeon dipterum TaxID=197152 RepID=A0A8S1D0D4_9INSE|nr:Hypothetical predicted protein [Cloeon dipterum]